MTDDFLQLDQSGKRVIGFGRFAGYAGMIDLLRGLGDRLLGLGYTNPFLGMGYTDYYHRWVSTHVDRGLNFRIFFAQAIALSSSKIVPAFLIISSYSLPAARTALTLVGNNIQIVGVPRDFAPFIFGFTGNGKVTSGSFLELIHRSMA